MNEGRMDTGENSSCSDPTEKSLLGNAPTYSKVKSSYVEIVSLDPNDQNIVIDNNESTFSGDQNEKQQPSLPITTQVQIISTYSTSKDDSKIEDNIIYQDIKDHNYYQTCDNKSNYDIYNNNDLEQSLVTDSNTTSTMETERNSVEMKEGDVVIDDHTAESSLTSCEYKKPKYSYAQLIIQAIHSFPGEQAALSQIYEYITRTYPYYQMKNKGWQNSVRHNLSLNCYFIRTPPKAPPAPDGLLPSKGGYWRLNPLYSKKLVEEGFNPRRNRKLPPLYLRKNEVPYYYLNENEKFKTPIEFTNYRYYDNTTSYPSINIPHSIDNILNPKGVGNYTKPNVQFQFMNPYGSPSMHPHPSRSKHPHYYEPPEYNILPPPPCPMQQPTDHHLSSNFRPPYLPPSPHSQLRQVSMMGQPPPDTSPQFIPGHPSSSAQHQFPPPHLSNFPDVDLHIEIQPSMDSYVVQHPSLLDIHNYRLPNTQDNPNIMQHQPQLHSYYQQPRQPLSDQQQSQTPVYSEHERLSFPSRPEDILKSKQYPYIKDKRNSTP